MRAGLLGGLFAAGLIFSTGLAAQDTKPVRIIVPFAAGGPADILARAIAPVMSRELKQSVVVENRAGAGGMIAIDAVAKSPPDGYLIGLGGAGALGTNLALQEKMSYDPRKDVTPVTGLAGSPFILAAAPSFQGNSLRDVLALARGSADKLAIGHGGNGTLMHLTAELFNQMAGTKVALVPYRGMAPVVTDLAGNHVALGIIDPPSGKAAMEGGKIKTIAITSAKRFPRLPDIPTVAESGLPGFESNGWFGIVVPAGTPADVITTLNKAFVTVLNDPAVVERIRALGAEPMPMSPKDYAAFINREIEKWLKVAGASGGKPN
jgi:tripartite-type tricarboxylate transporter receptor subunit TctC